MRVLVVEDEPKIAAALKKGLEQESYAVDVAHDGSDGLAFALDEPYDILVLDRMLPGLLDGVDIAAEVRKAGISTPIIMLTAKDQIHDRVEGLNAGADDYLVKPFAFEELLARMRALLRRPQETNTNELRVDDLVLDTVTRTVTRADTLINLSAKEYALLEYLVHNVNQTLTKNNLIQHVWDFDADVLPNTVEVYIGYLRNKIDKPFAGPPLIHTIRGFGYRLGVDSRV